jgi:SAM-dependent methyltransferase
MNDEAAMRMLLDAAGPAPDQSVLDVACGPGIVAAALAPRARRVVGIDLTPQMIELARERCASEGADNVSFEVGDVSELPYEDGSFERVVCRYALHHMSDPAAVVNEMARVCAPGGRVAVADMVVGDDAEAARRFNDAERLRDPSHARAMPLEEHLGLMRRAGLEPSHFGSYLLPMELHALLARSSAPDEDAVRAHFDHAIDHGRSLGVAERREGERILFEFPIAVFVGERTAAQR